MDLSSTVIRLSSGSYTVTRALRSTLLLGRTVADPSPATLTVIGSAQPLSGRELQRLPEGMRTKELKMFFSKTELKCLDATYEPDRIAIGAEVYQVQSVDQWGVLAGYFRSILIKVG